MALAQALGISCEDFLQAPAPRPETGRGRPPKPAPERVEGAKPKRPRGRDYLKHGISDPTLTAWWAIAAAELKNDKDKTQDLLLPAFARFPKEYQGNERAQLAIALWRLVGPDATKFLVKWFYDEGPRYYQFPHQRATFLDGIAKHRHPENRKLLVALVRYKGYETLDWQSLKTLIAIVNAWSDKPVVDRKLVEAAWHPYGEARFDQAADKARKEYPKETEALLRTLSQW